MISSQPYNPEALGKVETSRREQHHKFYCKMKKLKNKVVSWVENYPIICEFLNDFAREELEENQMWLQKLHITMSWMRTSNKPTSTKT